MGRKRTSAKGVYSGGAVRLDEPLSLQENTRVRLRVEPLEEEVISAPRGPWPSRIVTLEVLLLAVGVVVYAFTRLWALDAFPIYFFCDEAWGPLVAENLLAGKLTSLKGTLLPMYIESAPQRWTPILTAYFHIPALLLFGKSIVLARGTSALLSLSAAVAVALILKLIFKARTWWTGLLLLALAPAWFLHSRTAFDTVLTSTFLVWFLLFYLLYRTRSPRYLYAAVVFAAAAFYTSTHGHAIVAVSALLLVAADLRYHLRNLRCAVPGAVLAVVLAWPGLVFAASQYPWQHLRAVDSYWHGGGTLPQKVSEYAKRYAYALSPAYWFIPNGQDLERHRMKDYGHLSGVLFPFWLAGAALCLVKLRSAPYRALVLVCLATPASAALADVSIPRVLSFVPLAAVMMGLGLEVALRVLPGPRSRSAVGWGLGLALAAATLGTLHDTVAHGPLWYRDYGLYGMQYGAKQIFVEAAPSILQADPSAQIVVSSTWANGADMFVPFFLSATQRERVTLESVNSYLEAPRPLPDALFVMTASEYEAARTSGKFRELSVKRTVPYPDGTTGFYFVRLTYAENIKDVFARELAERRQPVEEQIKIGGQIVTIRHSRFDIGQLRDMLDGDRSTLVRGESANPLVLEFSFPSPRAIGGLSADFGSMDFTLTARLFSPEAGRPEVYTQTYRGLPPDPHIEVRFSQGPARVTRVVLEVLQLDAGEDVHVHVREVLFH